MNILINKSYDINPKKVTVGEILDIQMVIHTKKRKYGRIHIKRNVKQYIYKLIDLLKGTP